MYKDGVEWSVLIEHTKVVEHVLEEEEESNLARHELPAGEGHLPCRHANGLSQWVEQPNLRRNQPHESRTYSRTTYRGELDGEVREEDLLGALPLLLRSGHLCRLELPLAEIGDGVDNDPWDATPKVDELHVCQRLATDTKCATYLVKQEAHQARRNDGVPNPQIPSCPIALEPVELAEVRVGIKQVRGGIDGGRRVVRHGGRTRRLVEGSLIKSGGGLPSRWQSLRSGERPLGYKGWRRKSRPTPISYGATEAKCTCPDPEWTPI